jgi:nicotinate-nucleotide adenylyltransferase
VIPQRHDRSTVGLLGGSFNPAHQGHREISLAALDRLGLDAVWWLVTPGNPLKDAADYAPYEERLSAARRAADHPRIVVSNFEARKGLQYTVDTLATLHSLWPQMRFVWIMGGDSLEAIHLWKDWRAIFELAPLAVFARPGAGAALESEAARAYADFRIPADAARALADSDPPVWVYFEDTANPLSSTQLRGRAGPR